MSQVLAAYVCDAVAGRERRSLIRQLTLGHAPPTAFGSGALGMTSVYTHIRPETQKRELTELVVDLFEAPKHIRILADVARLRSQTPQPTLKQIGAQLGVSHMTVKRARDYARQMEELGVAEPFRELEEKPANAHGGVTPRSGGFTNAIPGTE
jgi:hypothetical protein